MNRRAFLKRTTAVGITLLPGCSGFETSDNLTNAQRTPRTTGRAIRQRTDPPRPEPNPGTPSSPRPTSNVVDMQGMTMVSVDVSERTEVSSVVGNVTDGEILMFPPGRFTWSDKVIVDSEESWGIRCHEETEFEVPVGWGDGKKQFLLDIDSDNYLLKNLTFDSQGRAAPGIRVRAKNRAHIDGLHYLCNGPTSIQNQTNGINVRADTSDSLVRVDDYRQFNNGDLGGYAGGDARTGVWVGPGNKGTVRLVNPVLAGFPNNGCYVSRTQGRVVIEDGLLINNNISQVRMSGTTRVYDTTMIFDVDRYVRGPGVFQGDIHNMRGIRGDTGGLSAVPGTGGVAKNCDFIVQSIQNSSGLAFPGDNERIKLEDCQFLVNVPLTGLRAEADGNEMEVIGCTVDGTISNTAFGAGDLLGSGNRIHPHIPPGTLPVADTEDYAFDTSRIHPETPRGYVSDSGPPVTPEPGP